MVEGSGEGKEKQQPGQETVGRQKDMVLPACREKLDSSAAERFILQEKSGSAKLLYPCRVQHGKGRTKVDADAACLIFWGAGEHREEV